MRDRRAWRWGLVSALVAAAAGSAAASPRVFVGVAPLRPMVQSIAGPGTVVEVLLPAGASPSTFEPQARQLGRLADADVLFTVGLPFEEVLARRLAKGLAAGKTVSLIVDEESSGAPHAWLDPLALITMAESCAAWFADFVPDSAAVYEGRAAVLASSYRTLDQELRAGVERLDIRCFATVHPAYSAFAARYGLRQIALESDGRPATGRGMVRVVEEVAREGARVLLVQPQHSSRQAEAIARELGLLVREVDPLGEDAPTCMWNLLAALDETSVQAVEND